MPGTGSGTMSDDKERPMPVVRGDGGTLRRGGEPPVDTGPAVALNAHLQRLEARARAGDELATRELERWAAMYDRHPSSRGKPDGA
jgi:hypothetical protein